MMKREKKEIKSIWRIAALLLFSVTFLVSRADAITDFTKSKAINAPKASVLVIDLDDGKRIAEHNASLPLIPASIMKGVTVGGLLEATGPSRRYFTEVYRAGNIQDDCLRGNLLVKGSGDPSLNSRYVNNVPDICQEISSTLSTMGVKRIEGNIKIDESIFSGPATPPSWGSGDLVQSYGTGQHGLNFEDNASGKSSVKNPSDVFRRRLLSALSASGITVECKEVPDGKKVKILTHESAPFDEIMRSCMMRSDNQYAESMLRTLAVVNGKPGSTAEGAKINSEYWKKRKAPMAGVNIVDGSGLSRSNRITADFMGYVLKSMSHNPYYASFFPLAGQEGTLRNFLADTPLEGYIAMKTGSMNGIQCYAGYKLDDDYAPTHVVVVMLNDMANRSAARKEVAKMLLEIFNDQ